MRIETHADRRQQRLRRDMNMTAAHERATEAQKAAQAWDDGFMRLCWDNYRQRMEREAEPKTAPAVTVEPVRVAKKEQPVNRLRQKAECFLSGMSIGAAVMLLIVWLLLLAAGVI